MEDINNYTSNSTYPLSYGTVFEDIQRYKKAGGPNGDSFNFFDSPSHKYYKIFFYFGSQSERKVFSTPELSGLLAPTWNYKNALITEMKDKKFYQPNVINISEISPTSEQIDPLIKQFDVISKSDVDIRTGGKYGDLNEGEVQTTGRIKTGEDAFIDIHSMKFVDGKLESIDMISEKEAIELFENSESVDITKDQFIEAYRKHKTVVEQYQKTLRVKQVAQDKFEADGKLKQLDSYNEYKQNLSNIENGDISQHYMFNTAWSYLKLQGYDLHALRLQQFIELLSNISIESPWYFSSVSGISDALNRKFVDTRKMDLSERQKISITCLPDAFDNRIDTLLELYRSVVFDWQNKREIIPANLRKFDMAIYVFEAPDKNWHKEKRGDMEKMGDKWVEAYNDSIGSSVKTMFPKATAKNAEEEDFSEYANMTYSSERFIPSFKLIEFHDCEIVYNTNATAWAKLDNQTGFSFQYNIDITFADCYEITYNDLLSMYYGDSNVLMSVETHEKQKEFLNSRVETDSNWLKGLGVGLLNRLNDKGLSLAKSLAFGNLYGFSLTNTLSQISNGMQNPMAAFDTVMGYAKNGKEMANQSKKQAKGIKNTMVNAVKNTIGYNEFASEYGSEDFTVGYSMSNPATMQIPSDTQVKRQATNNSNNYVKHIQQQLNSDKNIADNNILSTPTKTEFSGGSLFEAYTKSKGIKSPGVSGNIFKPSTIANNL